MQQRRCSGKFLSEMEGLVSENLEERLSRKLGIGIGIPSCRALIEGAFVSVMVAVPKNFETGPPGRESVVQASLS